MGCGKEESHVGKETSCTCDRDIKVGKGTSHVGKWLRGELIKMLYTLYTLC